jgi:hypothetical protein
VGAVSVFHASLISRGRERIRVLEGLLPICAYCKRIRDDEGTEKGMGRWGELEHYIRKRTDADFTHGICPECYEKVMAEMDAEDGQSLPEDIRRRERLKEKGSSPK